MFNFYVKMGAFALASLMTCAHMAIAQDSVAYQINPAHTGNMVFATGFAPPLKARWHVDLGGPMTYPIVAQGMVFVAAGNAHTNNGEQLFALSLATGNIVWQKPVSDDYRTAFLAYDSGRLFLTNDTGPLMAMDAKTGKPLWTVSLPKQYSFAFMPVATQGMLYAIGEGDGATIYQLNAKTGSLGWMQSINAGAGATLGGGQVYLASACDVTAYAAVTGISGWTDYAGCDDGLGEVAAYYHGRVYAPGAETNADGVSHGVAFVAKTGKAVGKFESGLPAFNGDIRYSIDHNRKVKAVSLSTGRVVWSYQDKDTFVMPPVVVNGVVYALSTTGVFYALNGTTGALLQKLTPGLGSDTNSAYGMAAGDDVLVVPSGSLLTAFAPKS